MVLLSVSGYRGWSSSLEKILWWQFQDDLDSYTDMVFLESLSTCPDLLVFDARYMYHNDHAQTRIKQQEAYMAR